MQKGMLAGGVVVLVVGAIAAFWFLTPDTEPDPTAASPAASAPRSKSRTVTLTRPVVPVAPADAAGGGEPDVEPDVIDLEAAEAGYAERLEQFQLDVQRAEACEILFDRHIEPFLRIEEALLSERLEGPEALSERLSILGTYDSQIVELLDKGNCP